MVRNPDRDLIRMLQQQSKLLQILIDGQGSVTVTGTVTVAEPVSVDDNGGSLTVDSPQLPAALAAGGGLKVEGVPGGATIPVSDGGGSLTVDGTVSVTQPVAVTDNAGSLTVDGTVTANAGTGTFTVGDGGGTLSIDDGGGSITVDGTVTATGTFTSLADHAEDAAHVSGDTGSLALAIRNDTAATSLTSTNGDYSGVAVDIKGRVFTDGSTVTQPVSGTVTANAGSGPFPVSDNGGSLTVDGTVGVSGTVTVSGTVAVTQPVAVTDNAGSLTVDSAQLPAALAAGGGLKVEGVAGGVALPVSGTVTANAGTNLNTSLLALETGGNLATAVASLSVMDDWDESDRAKVNPIAGQVGVQGGAGASTALTQRVAIATDANVVSLAAGTGTQEVVGDVASGVAVTANPVTVGGRASLAAPTAVADGQAVNAWMQRNGAMVASLAAAGVLITGDATNGLDVDVTRLPALVAGTANIGDVDVLTVPAPLSTTGGGTEATALRVTVANDSTGVLSVDDNGGSLTVDGTVTANAGTGTFIIGDGGGSITVDGTVAVTGATAGTEYTEDAASIANPVGGQLMARRRDALASETTTDGDVTALNATAKGELYVSAAQLPSVLGPNGGLSVEPIGDADEDQPHVADKLLKIGVVRKDADGTLVDTDGDDAPLQVNDRGSLKVTLTSASSLTLDVNIVGAVSLGTIDAASWAEDSAGFDGQRGMFILGQRNDSAATSRTSTDGDLGAIAIDIKGRLLTDGSTVTQPVSATQLPVALAAGGGLKIEGVAGGVAVPISGSIASDGNTADNAAFVDGTTKVTPAGFIFDEVAGTALTENDAAAARIDSKRAQVSVLEDATTRGQRAAVSAGGALKVDGSAATQPVSGTVTANAGTNLNTSALALEAGGNLAAAAASLSVMDDWDETDRAKVNPIVGQAGVQGGAGAITALTQRTVEVRTPTGTASNVTASASNVTLLASNAARLGAAFFNDSTALAYIKCGATASTTSHTVQLRSLSYYELPFGYTGIVDGIWASATGAMRVTEFT